MSTLRTEAARTALQPLRGELRRRAHAEAERSLAAARADVADTLARADALAADIIVDAHTRGEALAEAELGSQRADTRRQRRRQILATQQLAHRQLRDTAAAAVCGLRKDPAYPAMRDNLRTLAMDLLGPQASIVEDPAGGIVAVADGRRLDLSLPTIAARALERLEPEIGGLWR